MWKQQWRWQWIIDGGVRNCDRNVALKTLQWLRWRKYGDRGGDTGIDTGVKARKNSDFRNEWWCGNDGNGSGSVDAMMNTASEAEMAASGEIKSGTSWHECS